MKKQYLIGFSLGFILSGIVFTLSIVNYVSEYKQLKNDYEKSKEKESNNIVRINAMLEDKKQYEVKLVESEKSQIDLKNNQQVLQTISSILDQEVKSKVDFLKESLKQGLSQSHVIQLLGDGYSLVDDNGDLAESGGNEFWNFSYFKDSSYQPSSPLYVVDEQGLKQRKVGINLFISWNNKSLFFYSISYIQGNNIHFYIVQRDGTSSEDIKNIRMESQ